MKNKTIELKLKNLDLFDKHYNEVGFSKKQLSEPYQKRGTWYVKTNDESIADQLVVDGFVKQQNKTK